MKKRLLLIAFIFITGYFRADAQIIDIIIILTDKVVKAIDLKIQELQNQTINLQIIQKQAENEMSRSNLTEIGDWVEKQKDLYKDYYASLKQVKPFIAGGQNISRIVQQQKDLSGLYEIASSKTKQDTHLTEKEKAGILSQYATIRDESTKSFAQLKQTISSNTIQLFDADRIKLINQYANQLDGFLYRLQTIYSRTQQLSLQRSKDETDSKAIRDFYGLNH